MGMWWWKQATIEMSGARETAEEAAEAEGDRPEGQRWGEGG